MPKPQPRMPGEILEELTNRLSENFEGSDELNQFIYLRLRKQLGEIVTESPRQQFRYVVFEVLVWVDRRRNYRESWQKLLDRAWEFGGGKPGIQSICQKALDWLSVNSPQVRAIPTPTHYRSSTDPINHVWLSRSHPFFNRDIFRERICSLANEESLRVLKVIGPRHSGKSYSSYFLEHYLNRLSREERLQHLVFKVEVESIAEAREFSAKYLLRRIAWEMGINEIPEDIQERPSETRGWYTDAVSWLIGYTRRYNLYGWLVLDGFDAPGLPGESDYLIQELAYRISKAAPHLRLVLLGYDKPLYLLEQVSPPQILTEEILQPDTYPNGEDLLTYFRRLREQLQLEAFLTDSEIRSSVEAALNSVSPKDANRLYQINQLLRFATNTILSRKEVG